MGNSDLSPPVACITFYVTNGHLDLVRTALRTMIDRNHTEPYSAISLNSSDYFESGREDLMAKDITRLIRKSLGGNLAMDNWLMCRGCVPSIEDIRKTWLNFMVKLLVALEDKWIAQ